MDMFWWWPFGRVPEMSAKKLDIMIMRKDGSAPPHIIDVRTHAEWRYSHIEGAVNVPIQELEDRIPSLSLDSARPIIAICLTGHRSIPAVRVLRSRGFAHAVQLRGGMLAWWRGEFFTVNERGGD